MNRRALDLAREVADETGALFAGDIWNTNVFVPDDASRKAVRAIFEEQLGWAVEAGVDFVIGETFSWGEEALIALDGSRDGPARSHHARDPPGSRDTRGMAARRRMQATRGRRRRRRRAELHPRAENDDAALERSARR